MKKIGKNVISGSIRNIMCLGVVLSFCLMVLLPICSGAQIRDLIIEPGIIGYSETIRVHIDADSHWGYGYKVAFKIPLILRGYFKDMIDVTGWESDYAIQNNSIQENLSLWEDYNDDEYFGPFLDQLEGLRVGMLHYPIVQKAILDYPETLEDFPIAIIIYMIQRNMNLTDDITETSCTTAVATGNATDDRKTLLLQNIDNTNVALFTLRYSKIYYTVKIGDNNCYAMFGLPIINEMPFINEKGLGFAGNGMAIKPYDCPVDSGNGMPNSWLYRKTFMECDDVGDVEDLWADFSNDEGLEIAAGRAGAWPHHFNQQNMLFCDGNGGILAIEHMHTYFEAKTENPYNQNYRDILWHANHHKWQGELETGSVTYTEDNDYYPSTFQRSSGVYNLLTNTTLWVA